MEDFRYTFEKGSKKHRCPACHKKRFVRYIDVHNNQYIPEIYGRCDREMNCGYHLNPYKDGFAKGIIKNTDSSTFNYKPKKKYKTTYFPKDVFYNTRKGYEQNTFIQNLLTNVSHPFNTNDIENIITLYHLGTITKGYRKGATTFPFIDKNNNIRAIQVKQFDKSNHTTGTDFLHSIITKHYQRNHQELPKWLKDYNNNETKVSCLFGEHLLNKYPHNPIALVEAPKTAIYGTLYFGFPNNPNNLLWLAVYNLSSLNLKKCQSLDCRKVYLFPDLSKDGKAFSLWSDKAQKIQEQLQGSFFKVSDLLEQLAPEKDKIQGKDIADYLINLDWRDFRNNIEVNKQKPDSPSANPFSKVDNIIVPESNTFSTINTHIKLSDFNDEISEEIKTSHEIEKEDWSEEIYLLETFFKNTLLPEEPIRLNQGCLITNTHKFIKSHFAAIKANNGNDTFLPYIERLQKLKIILDVDIKEYVIL